MIPSRKRSNAFHLESTEEDLMSFLIAENRNFLDESENGFFKFAFKKKLCSKDVSIEEICEQSNE